ncbi:MAG: glycoside hydrolase family 16 protein [Oscillospiraceae bacterium]|nr:glycoside hydrolase family 16 protein [Oscillospiraceae bacterium]
MGTHGTRVGGIWCPDLVRVENGEVIISAYADVAHTCSAGVAHPAGNFTGGIETDNHLEFTYGYLEARLKFPNADHLWSAMWLQSDNMSHRGYAGNDGAEIDIYESSFYRNRTKIGSCIHVDGYDDSSSIATGNHRSYGNIYDNGIDMYSDYHTFGFLWTPTSYKWYIDGKLYRTYTEKDYYHGVSQVKEYLKLTVEIDSDNTGPYSQTFGAFTSTKANPAEFRIDYVRLYQNSSYAAQAKQFSDFADMSDFAWAFNKGLPDHCLNGMDSVSRWTED